MLLGPVFLLVLVELTSAQVVQTCVNISQADHRKTLPFVSALFPEVSFQAPPAKITIGHSNLTYICAVAIDEWIQNNCTDTSDIHVERRILDKGVQFPCAADYVGSTIGAPVVQVTYGWTRKHVSGWQLSSPSNVNSWAQLLVSYILPSVVFSFSIPRPYEFKISWEHSHIALQLSWKLLLKFVVSLIRLIVAALSISIDTVAWLFFTFAFAAPILFSGLYEARQDQRLIYYLERKNVRKTLPPFMIAKALFAILCGNLDITTAWESTMALVKPLEMHNTAADARHSSRSAVPAITNGDSNNQVETTLVSPSELEMHLLSYQPLSNENSGMETCYANPISQPEPLHNAQMSESWPQNRSEQKDNLFTAWSEISPSLKFDSNKTLRRTRAALSNQLKAMLSCQYPFGSVIGGPVIFYLGGFIYTLLVLKSFLGDEDLAEALAFGMWWMIIPHVASVSMLLLAGNNPSILEGYARPLPEERLGASSQHEDGQVLSEKAPRSRFTFRDKVYRSRFTPAWIQERGASKQQWLLLVFACSWSDHYHVLSDEESCELCEELKRFLTDAIILTPYDWIGCLIIAFILFSAPCLFGYITAYFTPKIGIACRAMTFLIYWCTQVVLLALWACYITWKDDYWILGRKIKKSFKSDTRRGMNTRKLVVELERKAEMNFDIQIPGTRNASVAKIPKLSVAKIWFRKLILVLGWFLGLCAFGGALLSSCAGSIMQVMGVYRNCLCQMNISEMHASNRDEIFVVLSTNLTEAIHTAQKYWIPVGAVSTVFLGVVCYAGWWYQTQFRERFYEVADKLGLEET